MPYVVELTNANTGARRILYDEEERVRQTYAGVLDEVFYFGTILVAVFETRDNLDRQTAFDVFSACHGGTWREVQPKLWLHVIPDSMK